MDYKIKLTQKYCSFIINLRLHTNNLGGCTGFDGGLEV